MMRTLLIALLIISGSLFVISVLLMSPKGGLGAGIAGFGGSNEYGSKKSVETTLKKVAFVTAIVFVACVLFIPYVNK